MLGDVLDSRMLFYKVFNLMYFNELNLVVKYNSNNRLVIQDKERQRFNELFHMDFSEFNKFQDNLSVLRNRLVKLNNFNSIDVILVE